MRARPTKADDATANNHVNLNIDSASGYSTDIVSETLNNLLKDALGYYPQHVPWIRLKGDLEYRNENYEPAMAAYVNAIITGSEYCTVNIQRQIDDYIVRRMIKCTSQLGCYMQAAILCQVSRPAGPIYRPNCPHYIRQSAPFPSFCTVSRGNRLQFGIQDILGPINIQGNHRKVNVFHRRRRLVLQLHLGSHAPRVHHQLGKQEGRTQAETASGRCSRLLDGNEERRVRRKCADRRQCDCGNSLFRLQSSDSLN